MGRLFECGFCVGCALSIDNLSPIDIGAFCPCNLVYLVMSYNWSIVTEFINQQITLCEILGLKSVPIMSFFKINNIGLIFCVITDIMLLKSPTTVHMK